ncbi:hypothetical protein GCM10009738_88140 [Kitasatospora viridis]
MACTEVTSITRPTLAALAAQAGVPLGAGLEALGFTPVGFAEGADVPAPVGAPAAGEEGPAAGLLAAPDGFGAAAGVSSGPQAVRARTAEAARAAAATRRWVRMVVPPW